MKKWKWIIIDIIALLIIFIIAISLVIFAKANWKWWTFFFIGVYIFNLTLVICSISNNDGESEKLGWIFFSCILPYIGHIFYIMFRIRRVEGKNIEAFEKEFSEFKINNYDENNENNSLNEIGLWQSRITKKNFYKSNIEVFEHGHVAYEKLIEDIKNAKKYIHIEIYILKESEIYERIKKLLFQKVKENVEVKIIFDKFGTWKVPIDEFKHLKKNGIQLAFYNVPIYPYVRYTDNQRLHRKFFIIDGKKVHFGGLNITDEYCSYSKKYGYWADLNISADGQIVWEYQSIFLYDWYKLTKEKLEPKNYYFKQEIKNSNSFILNFVDGPTIETNYLEDSLDYWINSSKITIRIATPYFVPSKKILSSFKNAIRRGVDVEIYLPDKPDKKFTYKSTLFFSNQLAQCGAKIYLLKNSFLHSKFGIFDNDFAYVGTNNIDQRSFYTNQEAINLIISDETIKSLNSIFDKYKEISILRNKKENKFAIFYRNFVSTLWGALM